MQQVLGSHSIKMGSVDLEEVDELFVLSKKHLKDILGVVLICDSQLFLSGLTRWLLS